MALACVGPAPYQAKLFSSHHNPPFTFDTSIVKVEPTSFDTSCSEMSYPFPPFSKMDSGSKLSYLHHKTSLPSSDADQQLISWTTKHPKHWTTREVLDWIFFVVEQENLDGSNFQGESYRVFTGEKLCAMTEKDFMAVDPYYGKKMYQTFKTLINDVQFAKPEPATDGYKINEFNQHHYQYNNKLNRNIHIGLGITPRPTNNNNNTNNRPWGCQKVRSHSASSSIPCSSSSNNSRQIHHSRCSSDSSLHKSPSSNNNDLVVYKTEDDTDMTVDLPCLGSYPISTDFEFPTTASESLFWSSSHKLTAAVSFTAPHLPSSPSILPNFSTISTPSYSSSSVAQSLSSSLSSASSASLPHSYSSSSSHSMKMPSSSRQSLSSCSSSSSSVSPAARPATATVSLSLSFMPSSSSESSTSSSPAPGDLGYASDDSTTFMQPLQSGPAVPYPNMAGGQMMIGDDVDMLMEDGSMRPMASFQNGVSSTFGVGEKRKQNKKPRHNATKNGNHLWEFVRDLLRDPSTNPKLLKWEDKEHGVFRFVQSEKVAQLWGEKKNNPHMTYEKLSRAMRFCRSAKYFDSVPKTGKFPKKLCFKFGEKAHGWKD